MATGVGLRQHLLLARETASMATTASLRPASPLWRLGREVEAMATVASLPTVLGARYWALSLPADSKGAKQQRRPATSARSSSKQGAHAEACTAASAGRHSEAQSGGLNAVVWSGQRRQLRRVIFF